MSETRRSLLAGLAALAGGTALPARLLAQTAPATQPGTYESDEIIKAGHSFFGQVSEGLAQSIEYLFSSQGRPNGYILGEEGSGAFVADNVAIRPSLAREKVLSLIHLSEPTRPAEISYSVLFLKKKKKPHSTLSNHV